jgi:DNA repair exonuclease SbcCD ATPase subunit
MTAPSSSLWIESLSVHHFAGIRPDQPITLSGFSPGINLIHGANGCGKTTTALAMQSLVWPSPAKGEYRSLHATLHQQPHRWRAEAQGDSVRRSALDGTQALPEPPPPEIASRYQWALRDLLQQTDQSIAARIAAEMAGGVDFGNLTRILKCASPPSAPRKLYDQWKQADRRLREARTAQKNLQDREQACQQLKQDLARREQDVATLPLIEKAQSYQTLRTEQQELNEKLAAFPEEMTEVRAQDLPDMEKASAEAETLRKELSELKLHIEALGPGESEWQTVGTRDIREARTQIEQIQSAWQNARDQLQQAQQALAETEVKEREYRHRLHLNHDELPHWQEGYRIPELRSWIQQVFRAETAAAELEKLEAQQQDLHPNLPDLDILRDARRNLEAWLVSQPMGSGRHWIGLGFTWTLLAGFVLHGIRNDILPKYVGIFLLFPVILEVLSLHSEKIKRRRQIEQLYPANLPQPEQWEPGPVADLVKTLDALILASHQNALIQEDRKRLDLARSKAEKTEADLKAVTRELFDHTDDIQVYPEWAAHFLEDVQQWRSFQTEVAIAEHRLNEATEACESRETTLLQSLKPWTGSVGSVDPGILCEQLRNRFDAETIRRDDLEKLRTREQFRRENLKKAEDEIQSICTRVGVDIGDLAGVQQRTQQLSIWQPLQDQLRLHARQIDDLYPLLSQSPEWLEKSSDELVSLREQAKASAQEVNRLRDEIRDVELRIEQAMQGRELHRLQEERNACTRALEEDRAQALHTHLLRTVLDWLQESCRTGHQPEVLKAANRYLHQFTSGALTLTLSLDKGVEAFMAGEPGHPPRPLQQLSSGERTQLIMAVRLAFLQQHETVPLPLFVDEALGTSDDQRSDAILHTLIEIAKEGRQIFYFTAQTDELSKWMQVLESESVPYTRTDLEAQRFQAQSTFVFEDMPATPAPSFARKPEESDAQWTARLQIPAWTPAQPLEDLHLWAFLHDHESALTACLDRGISTWGSLAAFIEAGAADHFLTPDLLQKIQARAAALSALIQAWNIGRALPVDPSLLVDSSIVSETFQEGMLDLLKEVNESGPELLKALDEKKLPRWRQDKTDNLRSILDAKGYIPHQPPLTPDQRLAKAYADLPSSLHQHLSPQDWSDLQSWLP